MSPPREEGGGVHKKVTQGDMGGEALRDGHNRKLFSHFFRQTILDSLAL